MAGWGLSRRGSTLRTSLQLIGQAAMTRHDAYGPVNVAARRALRRSALEAARVSLTGKSCPYRYRFLAAKQLLRMRPPRGSTTCVCGTKGIAGNAHVVRGKLPLCARLQVEVLHGLEATSISMYISSCNWLIMNVGGARAQPRQAVTVLRKAGGESETTCRSIHVCTGAGAPH
jgi:hypothetical protein